MPIILRQLYEEIRVAEEIHLIAGEKGLDHVVSGVHMVEGVDISSFLEGDEIVFTTGVALKNYDELLELVELNFQHNAAGMVINIGPFIKDIGSEIINFANQNEFPVFQVPWRVHMAKIMRYFTVQINLDEQKKMAFQSAIRNAVYYPKSEELYLATMMDLGYKRDWSYGIVLCDFYTKQSVPVGKIEREKYIKLASRQFRDHKTQIGAIEMNEKILLFFANIPEDTMTEYVENFWNDIQKFYLPQGKIYVGIGKVTNHIQGIGKCFRQAEQVLALQKKRNIKNQIVTYKELGLYKLLFAMEDVTLLQEYYQEHLGKLERYDRMNETDFMYFLNQYFMLGCSIQDVASQMHLHRNSVAYKLHKIEEITGFSLSVQQDRTRLIVALMIKEMQL